MKKRPVSIRVLSWIYILVGLGGIAAHITEFKPQHLFEQDVIWALLVQMLAIVSEVFMLRGNDWARWLAVVWIGFHVVVSVFHPRHEHVVHALIFAVFTFLLFRPPANEYFRGTKVAT